MAFDALAEVVNDEDGVYLNLPLNDIAIPLPQSIRAMHQVVYKVEVLYVLCLLLGGKQRQKVCLLQFYRIHFTTNEQLLQRYSMLC